MRKTVVELHNQKELKDFYKDLYGLGYYNWKPDGLSFIYATFIYSAIHDLGFILDDSRTFPALTENVIFSPSVNGLYCSYQVQQIVKWLELHFHAINQEAVKLIDTEPKPAKPILFLLRSKATKNQYFEDVYQDRRSKMIRKLRLYYSSLENYLLQNQTSV
ncbi:hypothetical protein IT409_00555 [Candidatus Falkowbacteria bacterium]|nr:hypothetical protein [Candidatus Falkowbacteria bacterium]